MASKESRKIWRNMVRMKAFEKFAEIEIILEVTEKHKMWLEDYKGLNYSIAVDGQHLMKWQTEAKKYEMFESRINCIGRKPNRCVIEFDGEDSLAKENLEATYKRLKDLGYGFIRSTHKGKSDYLWIEFIRDMKDKEIEQFFYWVAPKGSKIDANFASSHKVFPVLFAIHWKHSYQREMPIEFFEGNQVDFDALGLSKVKVPKRTIEKKGFEYEIIEKEYSLEEIEEAGKKLGKVYYEIIDLMKQYIDTKEENYKLIALWIIGTYCHNNFNTFPYLFINAMRGSGKTRLLGFIAALAKNASMQSHMSEAVLFRTAKGNTLIIDEFEHINNKEKIILRELLNSAYKKGMKIKRMKKVYKERQEKQEVEEFELYAPIVMANIHGMDEVLGDRCLTLILEKSQNPTITKIAEDFDFNVRFNNIRRDLVSLVPCRYAKKHYNTLITTWNDYVRSYNDTTTLHTLTTQTTQTTLKLFKKIYNTGIYGRNFELMFPLIILADGLKEEILNDILEISGEIIKNKREDEFAESKDVFLIDFISHQIQWRFDFISIKAITIKFREFLGESEDEERWLNDKWIGRALKRLNLYTDKRRIANGREVLLNVDKAKEKIKMFKSSTEHEETKKETIAN